MQPHESSSLDLIAARTASYSHKNESRGRYMMYDATTMAEMLIVAAIKRLI